MPVSLTLFLVYEPQYSCPDARILTFNTNTVPDDKDSSWEIWLWVIASLWNYHRLYLHKQAVTPWNTQILVIIIIRAVVPLTETLLHGRSMFDTHSLNSPIVNYPSLKNEVALSYLFWPENLMRVPRISLRQIVRWIPLDCALQFHHRWKPLNASWECIREEGEKPHCTLASCVLGFPDHGMNFGSSCLLGSVVVDKV